MAFEGAADPELRTCRDRHPVVRCDRRQPGADRLREARPERHPARRPRCLHLGQVLGQCSQQGVLLLPQLVQRLGPLGPAGVQEGGGGQLFHHRGTEVRRGAGPRDPFQQRELGTDPADAQAAPGGSSVPSGRPAGWLRRTRSAVSAYAIWL